MTEGAFCDRVRRGELVFGGWLSTASELAAGALAACRGAGDTAYFPGLGGKWRLVRALAVGQVEALRLVPRMLRKRAGLRRIRRLSPGQVRRLIWNNRLRLRDVA
ncbi:MAG TPA: hypothetical protein DEH11_09335 [Actinobacteria bacterium]|nr:hypothetical protein [Actinomycetota bacterium]